MLLIPSLALLSSISFGSTIRVGSSPVISSAGIYLAMERGYFKNENLEVEITDFNNSGASMTAILSKGELDVGAGNLSSSLFNAINSGQKFKLVADKGHLEKNKGYIALIVRKDHIVSGRFKDLKDLKGFKLGLTSLDGVSQQIIVERILSNVSLKPSDVEYVKLSYAEMNMALRSKLIDATVQIEPYLTKAELDGIAKNVLSAELIYSGHQSAAILFSHNFISQRPLEATKFMIAYLRGVKDYNDGFILGINKDKVITDLKKSIQIDNEELWNKMKIVGLDPKGKINQASLQEDLEWYLKKKYITKVPLMSKLIDTSFYENANLELKKRSDKK